MRRWLPLLSLWFAVPAEAGLFGSDAPGRIPVPARRFVGEVEDVGGTVVALERVTFDGEVYLFGTLGKGLVTVPFEQIVEATFEAGADADHRVAVVRMATGTVRIEVEADRPLFGQATFGNYRIEASDLRRLTVREAPAAERTPASE